MWDSLYVGTPTHNYHGNSKMWTPLTGHFTTPAPSIPSIGYQAILVTSAPDYLSLPQVI